MLHALSQSEHADATFTPLRVQILNPIDSKSHISPNEAERLVYYGHASYVGEGRKQIRYLADAESLQLRADMNREYDTIEHERLVNIGRGGPTQGEWRPNITKADKLMPGSPQERASQLELTLKWVAEMNRDPEDRHVPGQVRS